MTDSSFGSLALKFMNLAATYALPVVGKVITTQFPQIADIILPPKALEALGNGATFTQNITAQDGESFTLTLSPNSHPELFETLARAHAELTARTGPSLTRTTHFISLGAIPRPEQGGVNIGGLLGVSW